MLFIDCYKEKLSNMSAMQDGVGRVGKGSLGLPTAPSDAHLIEEQREKRYRETESYNTKKMAY